MLKLAACQSLSKSALCKERIAHIAKNTEAVCKISSIAIHHKLEFTQLLEEEKVNLNYDEEEFKRDLKNLDYFK